MNLFSPTVSIRYLYYTVTPGSNKLFLYFCIIFIVHKKDHIEIRIRNEESKPSRN